jgi:hypothetical protein
MLDDYTTNQLLELRLLCAGLIEQTEDIRKRADALLLIEYIDEELALRGAATRVPDVAEDAA